MTPILSFLLLLIQNSTIHVTGHKSTPQMRKNKEPRRKETDPREVHVRPSLEARERRLVGVAASGGQSVPPSSKRCLHAASTRHQTGTFFTLFSVVQTEGKGKEPLP
uniref:Secreted protein n=1 Tax=Cyclopterus lumpus TaxID=8103 RepID=A0A8C3AD15_CYCLU